MPRGGQKQKEQTKELPSKSRTRQLEDGRTGKVSEPSPEHNISMTELLNIIENKAKQMFEEEIGRLKSEVKSLNEQVKKLSQDRDAQKTQNDKLWFEINKRAKENQDLQMKLDALEQDTKMNNVRIPNFPEVDGDKDIKSNIETMANDNLDIVDFEDSDVVRTVRLGQESNKKPRDLIVTFSTREKRDVFLLQCKKTRVKLEDGSPLYVNEDLTTLRSKLFYDSRRLMKAKKIHGTWTQRGSIMVKITDDSKSKAIYNHEDLKNLLYETITPSSEEENSDFEFEN